ncbi:cytochrome C [Novimethylophilus kurashikiensis]|uniref:Cytochrome C n=1 Tax=Novimethylophilus kurashikiensis TaxID=1825523 RepID=A0A2R5F3L0_9PROT|nr:cytochrome c [Novimethylophilus kurashikiensis]GBG13080.1 cytochrome C [Novimethylophilus kurashikiensis]
MTKKTVWMGLLAVAVSGTAWAEEDQIELKPGIGREQVMANCVMCHSLDMIQINSPFMKKEKWAATVNKMRNVMGAPISDEDAVLIVDYLTRQYGVD